MRSEETTTTNKTTDTAHVTIVNRWDRTLIVLATFFLFVGAVLAGVSVWQGSQKNAKLDHIDKVVSEANNAARTAKRLVEEAVAPTKTPEGIEQARKTVQAVQNIEDIKRMVQELLAKSS